jgi:hypothetical protein
MDEVNSPIERAEPLKNGPSTIPSSSLQPIVSRETPT